MLENPWEPGIEPSHQPYYQPVQDFTYWPVLGCFKNWNSITISNKNTPSDDFE